MRNFVRTLVLAVSAAAVVLSAMPAVEASERHLRRYTEHNERVGEMRRAGILGLAVGATILAMLSDEATDYTDPDQNPYRKPRPAPDRPFFSTLPIIHPASGAGYGPAWLHVCKSSYRSFDRNRISSDEKGLCVAK